MGETIQSAIPEVLFTAAPKPTGVEPQRPNSDPYFDPADLADVLGSVPVQSTDTPKPPTKPKAARQRTRRDIEAKYLTRSDIRWIDPLVYDRVVNADWFEEANGLAVIGSLDLRGLSLRDPRIAEAKEARFALWEGSFGWGDPEAPAAKAYNAFRSQTPNLRPTGLMIATLRQESRFVPDILGMLQADPQTLGDNPERVRDNGNWLIRHRAKPARVFLAAPVTKRMQTETLATRWNNLDEQLPDVLTAVNNDPRVLDLTTEVVDRFIEDRVAKHGPEARAKVVENPKPMIKSKSEQKAKVAKRKATIERVVDILGLPNVEVDEVMKSPVKRLGTKKLFTSLKLFAKFGDRQATSNQFIRMITDSLESQILVVADDQPYTSHFVSRQSEEASHDERRERVARLLENPNFVAKLGRPIVKSYRENQIFSARYSRKAEAV
ncbi:MAG TPA: hypothetical protein VG604_02305 [Candidatus Saccharimonadales bacterium]|nr:hypothetical protein [Candidatus Saccharimonadales bacterium]